MAKLAHDDVLDALLDEIAESTRLYVCSALPTNYTEASTTYKLADVTVTAGDGGGDFTIADGDAGGRKLTVAAQSAIAVDSTGTATHVALCDHAGTRVLCVTTCTSQALTSGNTVSVPSYKVTVGDPT